MVWLIIVSMLAWAVAWRSWYLAQVAMRQFDELVEIHDELARSHRELLAEMAELLGEEE